MDVAATRWRATCCAAAATCGASGQARFPHLPCTSPSSEQGREPDPGALCACVSVSADGMDDPGQGPSFASGCRTSAPPPTPPHLPPSCCPRGRPRGEATSIYSLSVPPPASSFLPARLPPAPSRLSVLDPRGLAPRVGVGVGQAQTAMGYRLKMPHCVQGCEVDAG